MVNGKFYSTGGLSDEALKRYTDVFGHTDILARVIEEENSSSKYSEIKNKNISIFNGLNLDSNQLEKLVSEVECIIIRMPSFLGIKVLKYAKKFNKPYLIELVACPWDSLWNHSIKGKIIAPYMTIKTKKIVNEAEYVLYVTNEFLQNRYPTKGKSVACSNVVISSVNNENLELRLNKILENKKPIIIGTIGALDVKFKGQWRIIKALGKLKKEHQNIEYEYHLVGNGNSEYLNRIKEKYNLQNEVKFIGGLPHSEINHWLKNIDIYVQPSQQEGLPRALIEAMSQGLPCFGAKTGGIPELIGEKFIFNKGKNESKEILAILDSFTNDIMSTQASVNMKESKQYIYTLIETRRKEFFEDFMQFVKSKEGQ
ncbi:glycosyltransferase [Turicibacter sanguinis]|uniref:glycosyltransferase n=1 Tax=Turicibacter sanguinis TaxID=154288 RepID=UPI00294359CD|nr:glycosyltransferase [Turicibacter sanguinis]